MQKESDQIFQKETFLDGRQIADIRTNIFIRAKKNAEQII